jgi:tRNA threonylcarbamoyladenosine biosynthesis protein TsaE
VAESRSLILADPQATRAQGRCLAGALQLVRPPQLIIYLEGELGAGKTTLARGILEGLGHEGRVPSPTYTLVEPYALSGYRVYHIDLYRIRAARELDDLGLAEQLVCGAVALIEWPDHGAGHVPPADIRLRLDLVPEGRALACEGRTEPGRRVLAHLGPVDPGPPMVPAG